MALLRFDYVNWHGRLHTYLIEPESIEFGEDHPEELHRGKWLLHGMVVTRDGDPRTKEMGDNRRRSFIFERLRGISQVERSR
jgi:hypothetical protein